MNKFGLAALALALVAAGAGDAMAKKRNTGRNIAIGVGAAVATGIILSEAAKASSRQRSYYENDDHYRRCRQLWRQCDRGEGWACRRASRYCD